MQTTLFHKTLPPRIAGQQRPPALFLLHGRGANEDDLLGLAEFFDPRFFFIAPRAPYQFQSGGGFTWYDLEEIGKPEMNMFSQSCGKLERFIRDATVQYAVDAQKVFFLGFSMGTMMSYAYALTHPGSVAGVVACSGFIPEESDLKIDWALVASRQFFITHGTYDPVIPVHMGRRAKELLERANADVTYREYPMAHQINEESVQDIQSWLEARLGPYHGKQRERLNPL